MYKILDKSSGRVIGLRISQKLTKEDYETLIPLWEQAIRQHGKICMLWQMDDFAGWTPEAAAIDLRLDAQYHQQVERLAIVGDTWWEAWMAKVTDLIFAQSQAQYFDTSQLEAAWDWVEA